MRVVGMSNAVKKQFEIHKTSANLVHIKY